MKFATDRPVADPDVRLLSSSGGNAGANKRNPFTERSAPVRFICLSRAAPPRVTDWTDGLGSSSWGRHFWWEQIKTRRKDWFAAGSILFNV